MHFRDSLLQIYGLYRILTRKACGEMSQSYFLEKYSKLNTYAKCFAQANLRVILWMTIKDNLYLDENFTLGFFRTRSFTS